MSAARETMTSRSQNSEKTPTPKKMHPRKQLKLSGRSFKTVFLFCSWNASRLLRSHRMGFGVLCRLQSIIHPDKFTLWLIQRLVRAFRVSQSQRRRGDNDLCARLFRRGPALIPSCVFLCLLRETKRLVPRRRTPPSFNLISFQTPWWAEGSPEAD